jgi:hypothetical protein
VEWKQNDENIREIPNIRKAKMNTGTKEIPGELF